MAVVLAYVAAGVGALSAQTPETARATLLDAAGARAGSVTLAQTPGHGVLLDVRIERLDPGVHGIHIHETGACEAPSFDSAGGHFSPRDHAHGVLDPKGPHAGDLLNLHVPESGRIRTERLAAHVTLHDGAAHSLFDQDGSALVVHATADDYQSQPSGDAGERALCGVIER